MRPTRRAPRLAGQPFECDIDEVGPSTPPSAPRSGTASAHDDRLRYPIMTRKNNFNPGVNN
jgi:hypothetical protein